ncbi:uncharacterized protein LOC128886385 isoform X1 [Hylaeus anthracinus]|uniref:uncharacterized protein LOC128886385 isoform X1 n=1 Tax=Hylaeus anthracinus TaxID=313031 RepID=UPI0023B888C8|nr:uncharacterized protein LOC128886385 isoform X1 [Hylaeus anthracinus]
MPQIQKHRKIKRATVLIKRSQCVRTFPSYKSYKPLCEKLKSNNNSLAKALSKEKQECQILFSQNVALRAEVQDLGMKCNKRDDAIVNILQNSNEMLKMLVTVTGYLTNTISSCQEIASSAGRRDPYRRLSAKSPTKGVVKPMVSGHTITKPTINLSRVNMLHINNPSNLSMIEEVPTPPRHQSLSNALSPVAVPVTQRRYENSRVCRMPERVAVSSPRSSEENERRLSKRSNRHSGRISGRRSRPKSARLSGSNSTRSSIENFEHIGSPRVKLNDVSKLLQNSQSINIRMLGETRNDEGVSNLENSDNVNEDSQTSITIPETPPSGDSQDDNDKTIENKNEQIDNELDDINDQTKRNSNEVQNLTSNWEDPLEGPSWLFNNFQTVPCYMDEKTDNVNVSSNDSMCITLKATDTNDTSDSENCVELTSSMPLSNRRKSQTQMSKTDKGTYNKNENTVHQQNRNNEILGDTFTSTALTDTVENEPTVNLANFVTQRRGCFESEDEDDFTLLLMRRPRNIPFDVNDLKLPVLEESALKPIASVDSEPEITTTLRKISQIGPIPSLANNSLNESTFSQSMVKLPLLINNDYDNKDLRQSKDEPESLSRKKKVKKVTVRNSSECVDTSATLNRKNNQKKKNKPPSKDPSSAKVVLQKLDESDVKLRTPTPEEITHDSMQSLSPVSLRMDNSTDSDSSSASTNSAHTSNRPRRRKAPISMQEPNLRKKLRRNR